jgi:hypothetical protein
LEYKDTIINTFRAVGLALNPDGSQDEELKVKGLPFIAVGDYTRNDLTQLEDSELAIEVAQVEAACKEAKEKEEEEDLWAKVNEGDLDEEDSRGIGTYVTDLVRPSRDHRHRPAEDRYFLSYEAQDGDPLLEEDLSGETTDTESHLAGGWDEEDEDQDQDFDPDEVIEDFEMVQKDHRMSP